MHALSGPSSACLLDLFGALFRVRPRLTQRHPTPQTITQTTPNRCSSRRLTHIRTPETHRASSMLKVRNRTPSKQNPRPETRPPALNHTPPTRLSRTQSTRILVTKHLRQHRIRRFLPRNTHRTHVETVETSPRNRPRRAAAWTGTGLQSEPEEPVAQLAAAALAHARGHPSTARTTKSNPTR